MLYISVLFALLIIIPAAVLVVGISGAQTVYDVQPGTRFIIKISFI